MGAGRAKAVQRPCGRRMRMKDLLAEGEQEKGEQREVMFGRKAVQWRWLWGCVWNLNMTGSLGVF